MEVPQKIKNRINIQSSNSTSRYFNEENNQKDKTLRNNLNKKYANKMPTLMSEMYKTYWLLKSSETKYDCDNVTSYSVPISLFKPLFKTVLKFPLNSVVEFL